MTLGAVPVRLFGGPLDGDECTIDWAWLPNVLIPLPLTVWESEAYLDHFDHPVRPTGIPSALYSYVDRRLWPEMWLMHYGYIPLRST